MCPQVYQRFPNVAAIREDEDCLQLNIFVPVVSLFVCVFDSID